MREKIYEWADPEDPNPPQYRSKALHIVYLIGVAILIPIMIATWPWWGYRYFKSVIQ